MASLLLKEPGATTRRLEIDGDIVTVGGRTRKNVTGYEITRFLAGSMGLFLLATESPVCDGKNELFALLNTRTNFCTKARVD